MMKFSSLAALVALCCASASAQTLTTTNAGGNGLSGAMFDVVAINDICLSRIEVNLDPGLWNVTLYRRTDAGGYSPVANDPLAWTAIGTALNVVSRGTSINGAGNAFTPLPIAIELPIPAGRTQAFYVTISNGDGLNYTDAGTGSTGETIASNAHLRVLAGAGIQHPFTGRIEPRIINARLLYAIGTDCSRTPYQRNGANAALTLGLAETDGFAPARAIACSNSTLPFAAVSALTGAFDVGIATNRLLLTREFGGFLSPTGAQVVNVDLLAPNFIFLNGGRFDTPFSPIQWALSPPPTGVELQAQLVVLNPGQPDGFALSQAVAFEGVTAGLAVLPGPAGDDASLSIPLGGANCLGSELPFMGTRWTEIQVVTNGRIQFGSADVDFSPSIQEALNDAPSLGLWCDLVAGPAQILVRSTATGFRVEWNNVPYFGQAQSANRFAIEGDAQSGELSIVGLDGVALGAVDPQWLGLSAGTLGATDAGPSTFLPGATGQGATASAMLYQFAAAGNVPARTAGVTALTFTPLGGLGYSWSAR